MTSGGLLLGFDDGHVRAWARQRPVFDRFGARVTFFVSAPDQLDPGERRLLRALAADGHSIGAHGLRHLKAPEAFAADGPEAYVAREITPCVDALVEFGLAPRSFAYPNSRRDAGTDALLTPLFTRLRGGAIPRRSPVDDVVDGLLVPGSEIAERRVIIGRGVDTGRGTMPHPHDHHVVDDLLARAATASAYLSLYAHDVAPASPANHVHPLRLEHLLRTAGDLGLPMIGFDDLPLPS